MNVEHRPRAVVLPGAAEPRWAALADVLLCRAALVARVAFDHRPDPLAGLKVDNEDLVRLLGELPGLREADPALIAAIEEEMSAAVGQARDLFLAASSEIDIFSRIVRFAQLSALEAQVLAVACAVEVDPRRQKVVGYLNDDVSQRRLTLFTLELLFSEYPDVWLAAGPGSGLRRAALLVPPEPGPLSSVVIAPSSTVIWWLNDDYTKDPELPAGVEVADDAGEARGSGSKRQKARVVLVPGGDAVRRRHAAAGAIGRLLISPLPDSPAAWDALVRQATLEERGVLLELSSPLPPQARARISSASHLCWALGSREELPLECLPLLPWEELSVPEPTATDEELQAALEGLISSEPGKPGLSCGRASEPSADRAPGASRPLSASFGLDLSAEQLELVRRALPGLGGDLSAAGRRLAAGHISALASRARPSRCWEDLVLDPERKARLRQVIIRCRHRRKVFGEWGFSPLPSAGVVALFSGPPGTGKTLAAEIIAGELGFDLYKVDLAAVVSKWVGETEKNLSAIFDAAEASNAVLFFDEADALFAKRSEVSDAHDRYANIEVAHLLQRLERHNGLVIMATNLATNIDPAFLRRVTVSVDFPMPEEAERRGIWERSLPAGAPCKDLDIGLLARLFKLSGGSIRNAALTAAFLAADRSGPITMECMAEAVKLELRKLGRLVNPEEFGPYSSVVQSPS
jgi:hypothetical protein